MGYRYNPNSSDLAIVTDVLQYSVFATHAPDTHGRVLHGYVNQQHLKTAIRK